MLQKILRRYIFYLGIKNNRIIYILSKIDGFMTFSGSWAENAIFKFARKREKTARQRVRFFRTTYFPKNGFKRAVGNPRASEGQIFSLRAQRKSESGKNTFQEQKKSARITGGWNGQKKARSDLLSHQQAVSSALGSLTSEFGMGSGGSSPLWPRA